MAERCRAFKFQLQPTVKQTYVLERLLAGQRELYNAALEERIGAWRWERRSVTRFEQYRTLTGLREVRPETLAFGVTVCRGTLARLDLAFAAFFRRIKAGQTPGFPRFKGAHRFDSVSWPDVQGWKLDEAQHRLYLQGVGHLRYRRNQALRGTPKTITVRREGRRWFVTVFCVAVPGNATSCGDGRGAGGRRCDALHRPGPDERRRGRCRPPVRVDRYDVIVHEDLKITNMTRRPAPRPDGEGGYEPNRAAQKGGLNRSILDAGWGILLRLIAYKAEDAGRQVIAVDPRHTSDRCGQCGHTAKENRISQAVFRCRSCGYEADADEHAAGNILRAGLAQREAQAGREVRDVA